VPDPVLSPVELSARVDGDGPAVLLLHGLGGDHSVWNAEIGPLSRAFRVTAPDLRGHGRSANPDGSTYSFAELEGDLLALLDKASPEPVHLVGLSAGGFLALKFAIDYPARIRSLVVISGAAHCDAHTRAVGRNWVETYRSEGFDAYFLRLLKDLYYPDWVEAHLDEVDRWREEWRGRPLDGAFRWSRAMEGFDVRGMIGRIRLPTLVVQGMDDQVVDPSHGRLLRQAIPGAQLRLFPQTGHMVPVERPDETTGMLSSWLATGRSGGSPPAA